MVVTISRVKPMQSVHLVSGATTDDADTGKDTVGERIVWRCPRADGDGLSSRYR